MVRRARIAGRWIWMTPPPRLWCRRAVIVVDDVDRRGSGAVEFLPVLADLDADDFER
jgi:hypothetical protein